MNARKGRKSMRGREKINRSRMTVTKNVPISQKSKKIDNGSIQVIRLPPVKIFFFGELFFISICNLVRISQNLSENQSSNHFKMLKKD